MAQLKILGSCSGTEPMPDRLHTSLMLTAGDRIYFFDAGEGCSRTAHLSGADILKTRAIFISHTHYDHIGGLPGLYWCMRKVSKMTKRPMADGIVKLFIPDIGSWEGAYAMLCHMEGKFAKEFAVSVDVPKFGTFYQDENIKVTAFESHHIPHAEDGHCRAFSYRIETNGKAVVFSGDVRDMDDLVDPIGEGCDFLLCESGHHKIQTICDFADSKKVGQLVLMHHGREMLQKAPTALAAIAGCKTPVAVADDGLTLEI